MTVERCPDNKMLGRREIVDGKVRSPPRVSLFLLFFVFVFVFSGGIDRLMASPSWADSAVVQAGKYTWITYKEAYDTVIKVGASIRSLGVGKVRNSCLFMLAL
jgi:long-chain acyl-CoA synthetase